MHIRQLNTEFENHRIEENFGFDQKNKPIFSQIVPLHYSNKLLDMIGTMFHQIHVGLQMEFGN